MATVADIIGISISLRVDDKQALFILMGVDGSINRQGTGAMKSAEPDLDHDLFIGKTDTAVFESIRSRLSDEMLEFTGGYQLPEPHGAFCKLEIALGLRDRTTDGFVFTYGSQSQGPPAEIHQFVVAAVQLTDPWFESQKRIVRDARKAG